MKKFIVWAILIGGLGYGGAKLYLHNEVSDAMDMVVLMMAPYANVDYEGVGSTLSGELTVDGVWIRIDGFSDDLYIDRIGIDTPSFLSLIELSNLSSKDPDAMPEQIGFLIEGLRIPANADYYAELYEFSLAARGVEDGSSAAIECVGKYGFSPAALSALGYEDQVMSMYMSIHDKESRYSFDIQVSMADMWDLDANVTLAGNMVTEMMKGKTYQPRLSSMRIEFTDRSLNGRVTKYCKERGLTAAETMRAQIDSVTFFGESNGIEFDQYLIDPYKEFLLGKPTLVVTAQPMSPVAFSQLDMYTPSDVPALLNLAAIAR
jgi:hypothetical protein